jgi:hypothetical protein
MLHERLNGRLATTLRSCRRWRFVEIPPRGLVPAGDASQKHAILSELQKRVMPVQAA